MGRKVVGRDKRKSVWVFIVAAVVILLFSVVNWMYISYRTKDLIFESSREVPRVKFALLLGAPKYLPNGNVNYYYMSRIKAALKLYREGKINKIVVSGSILDKYGENEVELMRNDLIQGGVNKRDLVVDENGNHTWDSIVNVKQVLRGEKILIISQAFQLGRALYIAKKEGIAAIGFKAEGVASKKLWIREIFARLKMRIDLMLK